LLLPTTPMTRLAAESPAGAVVATLLLDPGYQLK
jgi:hypothetical protein